MLTTQNLKKMVVVLATAAGAGMASLPAQAIIVSGKWDPNYGGIFPDLGWQAQVDFEVSAGCLAAGFDGAPGGACDASNFYVNSAVLEFYNYSLTPDPTPGDILETFNLSTSVPITRIKTQGGALVGVETSFFSAVIPTLTIAGGGDYSFSLSLFDTNKAQLQWTKPNTASPSGASCNLADVDCGFSENTPTGVFTPAIPEPSTYALMFAGLAAVGFMARRRRPQA